MDQFNVAFSNLPDLEAPKNLRREVQRHAFILKYRQALYLIASLLLINFILLIGKIIQLINARGAMGLVRSLISNFTLNANYLANFFLSLRLVMPQPQVWALAVNLLLIFGLLAVFRHYRHELFIKN